jgi:CRP/FNR family transcriptional regulator, anaerobic regulatory protein
MISPNHKIELQSFISEHLKLSVEKLVPIGIEKSFPKNSILIEEGMPCNILFLVVSGVFRTYRHDNNENEITTGFTFGGDFDTSPFAFFFETNATESIQALTDVQVIIFKKEAFLNLVYADMEFQKTVLKLLSGYIETLEQRLHQSRTLTAEERYQLLKQSQPNEIKKIPKQFIASFLGITRERLSRIRKHNSQ